MRKQSVADIVADHWNTFGSDYYSRYDFEAVETEKSNKMMQDLRRQFGALVGQSHAGLTVTSADEFSYLDPVDGANPLPHPETPPLTDDKEEGLKQAQKAYPILIADWWAHRK